MSYIHVGTTLAYRKNSYSLGRKELQFFLTSMTFPKRPLARNGQGGNVKLVRHCKYVETIEILNDVNF